MLARVPTEPDHSSPTRYCVPPAEVLESASLFSASCPSSYQIPSPKVRAGAWGRFGENMEETVIVLKWQTSAGGAVPRRSGPRCEPRTPDHVMSAPTSMSEHPYRQQAVTQKMTGYSSPSRPSFRRDFVVGVHDGIVESRCSPISTVQSNSI